MERQGGRDRRMGREGYIKRVGERAGDGETKDAAKKAWVDFIS